MSEPIDPESWQKKDSFGEKLSQMQEFENYQGSLFDRLGELFPKFKEPLARREQMIAIAIDNLPPQTIALFGEDNSYTRLGLFVYAALAISANTWTEIKNRRSRLVDIGITAKTIEHTADIVRGKDYDRIMIPILNHAIRAIALEESLVKSFGQISYDDLFHIRQAIQEEGMTSLDRILQNNHLEKIRKSRELLKKWLTDEFDLETIPTIFSPDPQDTEHPITQSYRQALADLDELYGASEVNSLRVQRMNEIYQRIKVIESLIAMPDISSRSIIDIAYDLSRAEIDEDNSREISAEDIISKALEVSKVTKLLGFENLKIISPSDVQKIGKGYFFAAELLYNVNPQVHIKDAAQLLGVKESYIAHIRTNLLHKGSISYHDKIDRDKLNKIKGIYDNFYNEGYRYDDESEKTMTNRMIADKLKEEFGAELNTDQVSIYVRRLLFPDFWDSGQVNSPTLLKDAAALVASGRRDAEGIITDLGAVSSHARTDIRTLVFDTVLDEWFDQNPEYKELPYETLVQMLISTYPDLTKASHGRTNKRLIDKCLAKRGILGH